jgi:hypothetical protein
VYVLVGVLALALVVGPCLYLVYRPQMPSESRTFLHKEGEGMRRYTAPPAPEEAPQVKLREQTEDYEARAKELVGNGLVAKYDLANGRVRVNTARWINLSTDAKQQLMLWCSQYAKVSGYPGKVEIEGDPDGHVMGRYSTDGGFEIF